WEAAHPAPGGLRFRATPGLACDEVTRMAPYTSGSILVIDDEVSLVRALARLLQRDGYVVATARNGRHALAALQAQRYDVILCDLRMPELAARAFSSPFQQRARA